MTLTITSLLCHCTGVCLDDGVDVIYGFLPSKTYALTVPGGATQAGMPVV